MAVYKSTHCYPFLSNVDIRLAQVEGNNNYPVQFLTCKVDTSNKNITGYSIRVLSEDNKQVFPFNNGKAIISPISELQTGNMAIHYKEGDTNSGVNGTYLKIPFFQNKEKKHTNTYNAIYYTPQYGVEHVITDLALPSDYDADSVIFTSPNNWIESEEDEDEYVFNWGEAREEESKNNKIYLDGELLLSGEVVLVARTETSGESNVIPSGFYIVSKKVDSYTKLNKTYLKKLELEWDITEKSFQAIILKGQTLHNKVTKSEYDTTQESRTFAFEANINKWVDAEGNILSINTGSVIYKWEITLYQGPGSVSTKAHGKQIDYSNIGNENFDIRVSAGTILGSNINRIQIASDNAFDNNGNRTNAILPAATEGSLVLQGKYMSFGSNGNYSTSRSRVKTYDSVYGHVYPDTDNLNRGDISSFDSVRFYKHSLNPEDILDTETVKYGLNKNIQFHYYDSSLEGDKEVTYYKFMNETLINNRLYGIKKTDLEALSPEISRLIVEQDKILFMRQSSGFQNGVYSVYFYDSVASDVIFLKRAYSFNTWGSYIGSIFYVPTFYDYDSSILSVNVESLAGANPDYNLWNPDNNESGDSNLYFTKELPILLFSQKISSLNYVDLMLSSTQSDFEERPKVGDVIDGITLKKGMKVLTRMQSSDEWILFLIDRSSTEIGSWHEQFTDINSSVLVFVSQGQERGQRVWKITHTGVSADDRGVIDWSLYEAKVLKNTPNYTYLSPSLEGKIGDKTGMRLKFKGNNFIQVAGEESQTQWLSILDYDQTLYCIKHKTLVEPEVLESEVDETLKTPWKYEIRTFFKESDFNPFYCYENPYLILYKNGSEYSSLVNIGQSWEFWVKGEENNVRFDVQKESSGNEVEYQKFVVGSYEDSNVTYSRVLKLSGKYVQGEGLSWESYRWILTDKDGKILQDTGKKYDKEMSVLFYGLSNDSLVDKSIYFATLYVEDELHNVLAYTIRILVKTNEAVASSFPFTATYDCGTHAIKLDYTGADKTTASYYYEQYDKNYLYFADSPIFDGGIKYIDDKGFTINHKNGVENPIVNYKGSTILETDKDEYEASLSMGSKQGVPYYAKFNLKDAEQSSSFSENFNLPAQTDLEDDMGQFYFETEFTLNDDHCGNIAQWFAEAKQEQSNTKSIYFDHEGIFSDSTNYLVFKLYTISNLASGRKERNSNANIIYLDITAKDSLGNSRKISTNFSSLKLFTEVDANHSKYYLQRKDMSKYQTSEYEFLRYNLDHELYFKKDSEEGKEGTYFTSGVNDFGNLCLTVQNTSSPFVYWVEDRPFLAPNNPEAAAFEDDYALTTVEEGKPAGQFLAGARTLNANSQTGILKWPSDAEGYSEENYYWNEGEIAYNPIEWESVDHSTVGMVEVCPFNRHYGVDRNDWHVVCKINNIEGMFDAILDNSLQCSAETLENGEKINFSSDFGSITMFKIKK